MLFFSKVLPADGHTEFTKRAVPAANPGFPGGIINRAILKCAPLAVGGAAGCFYASFVGTLVPDAFFVTEAFNILAMVIVGGMGTLIGPVFGAILLTLLPELLRGIGDLRLVVYGAALTFVVLFMPGGLAQAARQQAVDQEESGDKAARIVREKVRFGGSAS